MFVPHGISHNRLGGGGGNTFLRVAFHLRYPSIQQATVGRRRRRHVL